MKNRNWMWKQRKVYETMTQDTNWDIKVRLYRYVDPNEAHWIRVAAIRGRQKFLLPAAVDRAVQHEADRIIWRRRSP